MHASHDSWVLLACLACGGNVFFDKKPHILFRRYNTNTSIDGGKLKSRLKYEFRYFEKYKNNRLDEENGRCEAAEVAALCLANLYNSGGHRKITPDEYETIKKYLQKFPESMHIRAAFIIASEAIYSPSAEYKRVPDKIINKAKQWSEQYPKKIEFQEAYFGLLFSRLKYAQAQDMRNEQRRVYREMKTVTERANYSEYNESNQLMESVDILHRVFGY